MKLFSASQLNQMGAQAFDSLKTEQKVSTGKVDINYVNCVANAITKHVPETKFAPTWEVVVFDEPQINAFALPGGKIGVYTGLLEVAQNQHQLAAVIGHEVAHVLAEHGNERMSTGTLVNMGMQVTNQILETNQVGNSGTIMAAIGLGVQVGVQLPFGRTHESEADQLGLHYMARAGFDPREATKLWVNMGKAGGDQRPPEFLSTHPLPQTRIRQIESWMPEALEIAATATDSPQCDR